MVYSIGGTVQTLRLFIRVVDVEVPWNVQVADESGLVGSLSLVSSGDGAGAPQVCPVDVLLKQSNTRDHDLTQNYRHTKPKVSECFIK